MLMWMDIIGHAEYEVSSNGDVRRKTAGRNTFPGKMLKPTKNRSGYMYVNLTTDGKHVRRAIHRLVAAVFCVKGEGLNEVNHLDNNPSNNHYLNLEWSNRTANNRHIVASGRNKKSSSPFMAAVDHWSLDTRKRNRATRKEAENVRRMYGRGVRQRDIAVSMGFSQSQVSQIIRGQ